MSAVLTDVQKASTMADLTKVLQDPNAQAPIHSAFAAPATPLNRSLELPAPPILNTFDRNRTIESQVYPNVAASHYSQVWNDWLELKLSSPVDKLRALKKGFDGYRADPPSIQTLSLASKIWLYVCKFTKPGKAFPRIEAGPEDFVEFKWLNGKNDSFEIWIYGQPSFSAEWFSTDGREGQSNSLVEVISVIQNYLS